MDDIKEKYTAVFSASFFKINWNMENKRTINKIIQVKINFIKDLLDLEQHILLLLLFIYYIFIYYINIYIYIYNFIVNIYIFKYIIFYIIIYKKNII